MRIANLTKGTKARTHQSHDLSPVPMREIHNYENNNNNKYFYYF